MLREFQTHTELNPKIWTTDQKMSKKVRTGFLKIAYAFYKFLEIDTPILDIILIGSNANYNWAADSDIDIHVVVNYSDISDNIFLVDNYLRAKKSIWSSKYPLRFKEMEIELYAQDSNHDLHESIGIFSLIRNQWIQLPTEDNISIDDKLIRQKAEPYEHEISQLSMQDPDIDKKIKQLLLKLRNLRKAGLDASGEYSIENLAFKYLRSKGLVDQLKDMQRQNTMNQLIMDDSIIEYLAQHVTKQRVLSESEWDMIIQKTGGIEDPMGQWSHPGRCTMIPSNQITMQNVPHKVLGIDDTGHMQIMQPEQSYSYPGTRVFEIPHTPQLQTFMMQLVNKIRNGSKYVK